MCVLATWLKYVTIILVRQDTSHHVYKTTSPVIPRVNIQEGKGGKAKPYQVRQVLVAIAKMKGLKTDEPGES